ncbi:hypothetical protein GOEFS_018_01030 [Gordonia effusa NBRC 100432]|uniref:Ribbon-helix-helix protein CopG domain-containing protein n=1 Tax=Gordonia effusa NBRC 100432 TaxID=1077974 RepID=H0QW70_9ACTN|nr:hypothetical protein [Gordonia effusa]GAB17071.1 hypothetical protein GOEFS_018_01030 [Gordonia effusa NBRC 100432]
MTTRRSTEDYAAMADEFEHESITPVGAPEVGAGAGIRLRDGRQVGRKTPGGNTPTTSVRLPASIRSRLDRQAGRESIRSGELIRKAVVEYLDRHGA